MLKWLKHSNYQWVMNQQILQLESKLALEDEALKTSYVERVAKDKQAALMGLDSVVKTRILPQN